MAGDLRGVYLIGNKSGKVVTAVLVQNRANGVTSTLPLDEYVRQRLEPADGTLPWEEDIKEFGAAITGQRDTPTALRMATSETAPYPTAEPRPANLEVTQALPPQPAPGPVEVKTIGGGLVDNADVFRAEGRVIAHGRAISFRANAERAEMLARALSGSVREHLARLMEQGRNEPEWRDQIDFLDLVAARLDNIADAIAAARQATSSEERDQKFSEAEGWAASLAKAAKDFAGRNYERVVDFGGYCPMTILSTLLFTQMLGASPDVAFVGAMGLLGFGKKKD